MPHNKENEQHNYNKTQQIINEGIKTKHEDEKINYIFSILNYPIGNDEILIDLHVFKLTINIMIT